MCLPIVLCGYCNLLLTSYNLIIAPLCLFPTNSAPRARLVPSRLNLAFNLLDSRGDGSGFTPWSASAFYTLISPYHTYHAPSIIRRVVPLLELFHFMYEVQSVQVVQSVYPIIATLSCSRDIIFTGDTADMTSLKFWIPVLLNIRRQI